jgi:hypothetical protein
VKRFFIPTILFLLTAAIVRALVVQNYDPQVNDRFASGFPDAPVINSSDKFVGKGFDWSGVGWWKKDPQYSVALISSKNFTCAKHMSPATGDVLTFFGKDGKLHNYHVARVQLVTIGTQDGQPIYADSSIGTLQETVPFDDQVAHYPVAYSDKGFSDFINKKILMYGHMARIGTNQIEEGIMLENIASEFNPITSGLTPGMSKCEIGDSGSPSFMVIGGKLALVGTHWKTDADSMVSGLTQSMKSVMAADGTQLETVPVGN